MVAHSSDSESEATIIFYGCLFFNFFFSRHTFSYKLYYYYFFSSKFITLYCPFTIIIIIITIISSLKETSCFSSALLQYCSTSAKMRRLKNAHICVLMFYWCFNSCPRVKPAVVCNVRRKRHSRITRSADWCRRWVGWKTFGHNTRSQSSTCRRMSTRQVKIMRASEVKPPRPFTHWPVNWGPPNRHWKTWQNVNAR